jgi:long-chain acyl-CoA synthetase
MNLVEMLEDSSRIYGKKNALIHGERHLSYADLNDASIAFASALSTLRIRKGDRVAMLLGNSIEFVTAYFGIVRAGAVVVLLDPKYKPDEIISLLNDCCPKMVIIETSCLDPFLARLKEFKYINFVLNIGHEPHAHSVCLANFIASGTGKIKPVHLSDDDIAHISYTSGPSFNPRGVMAPHGNLLKEIKISAASFEQSHIDLVIQFALPMHHVIGLVVVLLTSIYCGSSNIILNGVSIDSLTSAIERHGISVFMGVPFVHAILLRKIEEDGIKCNLKSLRICASAGDILPTTIVEKYKKLLNLRLINFYGLTETMGHVTCESIYKSPKPGSVGSPLDGWQVKVVDPSGRELPAAQPGEVVISGPMMTGFYQKPQATADVIKDGWLHTGDRGVFDETGCLYILGLQKDMLICKGQNIFPSDIEHVISQHPSVAKVAVVGVPDKMRGEVVGAAISFNKNKHISETALLKYCLERLANYKVPKYFVFMDDLPGYDDGSVKKTSIKEYFVKQLRDKN